MKLEIIAQSIAQAVSLSKSLTRPLGVLSLTAALSAPVMAVTLDDTVTSSSSDTSQPSEEETMYAPQDYISDFPGEMIGLQGREIKLVYDDVDIPGNGGMDLVVTRRINFWGRMGILLPSINLTRSSDSTTSNEAYNDSCLGDYYKLNVYMGGDRLTSAGVATSADVPSGTIAVYGNNVYLACDPNNSNIAELHLPDGKKHRFIPDNEATPRLLKLFETVDRYGNRINYEWEYLYKDGQVNNRRISKISRQDSPTLTHEVNFVYDTIEYSNGNTSEELTQITWNNGTKSVSYGYDDRGMIASATDSVGRTTTYEYDPENGGWLYKVITPTGLSVTYTLIRPNGRAGAGGGAKSENESSFWAIENETPITSIRPRSDWLMGGEEYFAVSSRTIEGPGIEPRTFKYVDDIIYGTSESQLYIIQQDYDGEEDLITAYTFRHSPNTNLHGRIRQVRLYSTRTSSEQDYQTLPSNALLYQKDTVWQQLGMSTNVGCTDRTRLNIINQQDCRRFVTASTTVKIRNSDGDDVFTTTYSDYNTYGTSGKQIQQFGNNSRMIKQSYDHDIEQWILNQPRLKQIGATEGTLEAVEENVYYDKNHSDYPFYLEQTKSFGVWQKKFSQYHSHGGVQKVEYNALLTGSGVSGNRYTEYQDYKLGTAQMTKVPNRYGSGTMTSSNELDTSSAIRVETHTDFNGHVVYKGFDDKGRELYVDYADANQADVRFEYIDGSTSSGPVTIEQRCVLNGNRSNCDGDVLLTTTTTYSAKMKPLSVAKSDGFTTIYQNTQYDALDRAVKVSYPSYMSGHEEGKSTSYDPMGRVTSHTVYGGGTTTTNYLQENKVAVTDPRGNVTTTSYQAFDGPSYKTATRIESPESVTTDIAVNVFGETVSVTQSGLRNGVAISDTETRLYNSRHQLCMIKRNDVGNSYFKFNAIGETIWQAAGVSGSSCDNDGSALSSQKISFAYDNLGDKWIESFGDNTPQRTYTLDNNGNLKEIRTVDFVQSYNYNSVNVLEDESLTIVADNKVLTLDYGYDAMGALASLKYPGDTQPIEYAPDAFGRATKAVRDFGSGLQDVFAFPGVSYHPNGIIESFTYGNGILHQTNLNQRLAPQYINDFGLLDLTYSYDDNNNITSLLNARENGAYSLTSLSYDGLDRLTATVGGSKIGSSNLTYDGLGNILSYSNNSLVNGHNLSYTYDSRMRLSSLSGNGSSGYDFMQSNVPLSDNNDSYDSRGNVIHNGKRSFEYNLAGQMIQSESYSYLYDGHNRRIREQNSKGVSYSFYSQSGHLLYRETQNGGIKYIFLGDKQIAKEGAGVNIQAGSNMNYKPFGESIEAPRDDVGYTGHKFDTDLGLNYMQARYYDPKIGRFYANDPLSFRDIHSFNRYAYAANNPYKYVDPDGKDFTSLYISIDIPLVGGLDVGVVQFDDIVDGEYRNDIGVFATGSVPAGNLAESGMLINAGSKPLKKGLLGASIGYGQGNHTRSTFEGTNASIKAGLGPISLEGGGLLTEGEYTGSIEIGPKLGLEAYAQGTVAFTVGDAFSAVGNAVNSAFEALRDYTIETVSDIGVYE